MLEIEAMERRAVALLESEQRATRQRRRRDLAARAMQGMLASESDDSYYSTEKLTKRSFEIADAMLEAE